ncbi:unnamed protein product [Cyprideis torosa]|uniref:Uncharacterized protein n=1 Tax=Cyprideis torosa TaxID=163714 RepID=A0A7R8WP26_9CRUS|nr:unnamed protein product [Cyprideis torosa]CAG0900862.1 unnamed protein product [Cyprideis torosa]
MSNVVMAFLSVLLRKLWSVLATLVNGVGKAFRCFRRKRLSSEDHAVNQCSRDVGLIGHGKSDVPLSGLTIEPRPQAVENQNPSQWEWDPVQQRISEYRASLQKQRTEAAVSNSPSPGGGSQPQDEEKEKEKEVDMFFSSMEPEIKKPLQVRLPPSRPGPQPSVGSRLKMAAQDMDLDGAFASSELGDLDDPAASGGWAAQEDVNGLIRGSDRRRPPVVNKLGARLSR